MQLREGSFYGPRPTCPKDPKHQVHRQGFYERYEDCDSQRRSRIERFLCPRCRITLSVLPKNRLPYFSPGPKLNVEGKVLTTHLCLILDDHSRLIASAAYYLTADSYAFHHTLKEAVQRRGIPYKPYTDQGKPFTNKHTKIIYANLGIRLLHAKPYSDLLQIGESLTQRARYTIHGRSPCRSSRVDQTGL